MRTTCTISELKLKVGSSSYHEQISYQNLNHVLVSYCATRHYLFSFPNAISVIRNPALRCAQEQSKFYLFI